MGKLAEAQQALPRPHMGLSCLTGKHLASMDSDDAKLAQAWLADKTMATTYIADLFTEAGFPVGESALGRHRAGRCQCGKAS